MGRRDQEPTDGRRQRAEQRRVVRKEQLLAVAGRVFSRRGYHACSVADVLAEAGVARGTFYLYFSSKRAVLDELMSELLSQLRAAVFRIRAAPGTAAVMEQMERNVRGVVDVLVANREVTLILLREAGGVDADFDQRVGSFYDQLLAMIQRALELGQQMGLVRPCDTRLASFGVLGSLKEIMARSLASRRLDPEERTDLAREVMAYNLHGLFVS